MFSKAVERMEYLGYDAESIYFQIDSYLTGENVSEAARLIFREIEEEQNE